MNNPIKIFHEILNAYLKYINSGLPFFQEEYNQERNDLLREAGTICQPPIIEIVPKYHEKATLAEFCRNEKVSMEINDFVNTGLFVNNSKTERRLYDHQYDALKNAFIERKNIVVTTGTGSGKTECFLLPVIADLVKESEGWGKSHPRAMRTMILYPLNALAEDQMIRLRKALNSRKEDGSGALDWLDLNRNKHRFFFGRYTGATPVSGTKEKAKSKWQEEKKAHIEDWKAAKEAAIQTGNNELLYHVPCMEEDSAEMWDRFSMQDNAPDILITNYSMLNVMLMRETEADIFNDTKDWLKQDKSHVFHLVIDELHSYRGTSGTEVAYLLRILLDRLGLSPDSDQVQFLASSASLEQNKQSIDFLAEFFGIDKKNFEKKFVVLSNPEQPEIGKPNNDLPITFLSKLSATKDDSEEEQALLKEVSCADFTAVTKKYKLLEWLKYSLGESKRLVPKDVEHIAEKLDLDKEQGLMIVAGLIKAICKSKQGNNYIAPIRAHFFFRNISGLWACSDPQCSCQLPSYSFEGRLVGRLYKRPRAVCECGNRVLEALLCENCGELYLGGYKIVKGNQIFLDSEKPVTESFAKYCVLWKGEVELKEGWKKVSYNPLTGECVLNMDGEYVLIEQENENKNEFPSKCPKCEVSYPEKDKNSVTPIRRHGTGLQKVNQILADSLIRTMKNENESNTKVVLFSDSRQSAAKLSAGIELDHYRDVLRWAILHALNGSNEAISELRILREKSLLDTNDKKKLREYASDSTYGMIANIILFEKMGLATEEDTAKVNAFFNCSDALMLDRIENDVFSTLLSLGMNPAGPKPSAGYSSNAGIWSDLYDFEKNKVKDDLSPSKQAFGDRISRLNKIEQMMSIFSNRNRSFEELKLGYLAPSVNMSDGEFKELACSAIRILGEKKKINDIPTKYPPKNNFPINVRNLVKKIYNITATKEVNAKLDELRDFLRQHGIIDKYVVSLTGDKISFVKSNIGDTYWICPRCKTVHMHRSNGICINCFHKLTDKYTLTRDDVINPNDYYLTLLNSTENIYRLHCEEMTGQTSKSDSKKRQRLFQDIFLKTENPKVDGIDLLSVTTTMEAGVDIGSLSAVMMGNVPPQRFNYQQRVGRAGRRGNPMSLALTVARNSSHDITNFFEYRRMVSDTPKDPYLEVRTREIAERIIIKEVLYASLKENSGTKDSVHGNFGTVEEWPRNKELVLKWLSSNVREVKRIIDVVTKGTEISSSQKDEIFTYIYTSLIDRIAEIATSNEFTQQYLSERLANAGLLPMFGFPTRTRNLYLKQPTKLPSEDVVSRDIDMALSSFAPGHEIVKDKKVYKAIGVVDYEYNKNHLIQPKFNSLNVYKHPLCRCFTCGYSTIIQDDETKCPVCGHDMEKAKICSPLGFCVDYSAPAEDFNGSFDWFSPNSDIKLDCEKSLESCPNVRNLTLRNNLIPSQGLVHLVNDNNGDFYHLGKGDDGIYKCRDVYPEDVRDKIQLSFESKYAFVSSKSTGILTLSVDHIPSNLCLSPLNDENSNSFAVRAAFISWGYLIRKAVASYLDIDSSELSVGFYITPVDKKAEVFFVEKLENGAGYCNYLSGRRYSNVPYDAIIKPLLSSGEIYEQLVSNNHKEGCSSSCYDCIRDYSNQNVHSILDWRLGLDLARLADDEKTIIDFTTEYWKDFINGTIVNVLTKHNYTVKQFENTLCGETPIGGQYCLIHPLWSNKYIQKLLGKLPAGTQSLSVFQISKFV